MPLAQDDFSQGLTNAALVDVLCGGIGVAWSPREVSTFLNNLTKPARDSERGEWDGPLIDNRGVTVGTEQRAIRLYQQDQILIAWVLLEMRRAGMTHRRFTGPAYLVMSGAHGPAWITTTGKRSPTPADLVIDQWRAGETGFAFEIVQSTSPDGEPANDFAFTRDGKRIWGEWPKRKGWFADTRHTFSLDRHLARFFKREGE